MIPYLQIKISREAVMQLMPQVAASVGVEPQQLESAMVSALGALTDKTHVWSTGLRLKLSHICRNSGCHDLHCELCQCNPNKECTRQMDLKYMVFESLTSGCGVGLHIHMIQEDGTDASAWQDAYPEMYLQVCVINARAYEAAVNSAERLLADESCIDQCVLPTNKQGSHLLVSTEVTRTDGGLLSILMVGTEIALPSLSITESSEGLLGGQKPPVQLVFRAMDEHGQRIKAIPPLLSDAFVVTTIRSSGKKPDIPLMTDPVGKIQAIGKETVAKLKNLTAAAAASSDTGDSSILQDFCVQHNSITTVQDFQVLTHWCSQDLDRTKAVQRALKILRVPKGWQTATAHAKTAVAEDNHPRMFTSGGGLALVYRCRQGKVDLSTVLDRVQIGSSGLSLDPLGECSQQDLEQLQHMHQQASVQWRSPGHTGWSIVSHPLSIPTPQLLPETPAQACTTHKDRLGRVGSFMGNRLPAPLSDASARSGSPHDIIPANKDQQLVACSTPSSPLDTASSFSQRHTHKRSMRPWDDNMFPNHRTDFAPDAPPQSGLNDNTSRASLPKAAKSAGIGESVQPSAAQGGFSPQGFDQFHTASHLMSPRRSDSEVQSPDFATLLGLVSPEDTPALQPTPGSLNLPSQVDSVLPNLQGLSQLPSQLLTSGNDSLQYCCNDTPIPAFTQSQFPNHTHISGQPNTENPSSDCIIRLPSTLSQQLSNSFPSIHPYFNSNHSSSAGHTQQPNSASPSFTDILNAECFPDWIPSADEPGNSP